MCFFVIVEVKQQENADIAQYFLSIHLTLVRKLIIILKFRIVTLIF